MKSNQSTLNDIEFVELSNCWEGKSHIKAIIKMKDTYPMEIPYCGCANMGMPS